MASCTNDASDWRSRTKLLYGEEGSGLIASAAVFVAGLGAVGSFAVEALARSGVGQMVLVDFDAVEPSNINRQLYALHSTVGQYKAEVSAKRCLDINPALIVHPLCMTYDAAHRDAFFTVQKFRAGPPVGCVIETIRHQRAFSLSMTGK